MSDNKAVNNDTTDNNVLDNNVSTYSFNKAKYDAHSSLPEEYEEDIIIPHVTEVLARVKADLEAYDYVKKNWDMRPTLENYKKITMHKLVEKLNAITKLKTNINISGFMKNIWDEYIAPNLDKYQEKAIMLKYDEKNYEHFHNVFYDKEMCKIISSYLSATNWPYKLGNTDYTYCHIANNRFLYITFTDKMLDNVISNAYDDDKNPISLYSSINRGVETKYDNEQCIYHKEIL